MAGRILVGVDGSQGSRAALAWAAQDALAKGAALDAAIVGRTWGEAEQSRLRDVGSEKPGPPGDAGYEEARQRLFAAVSEVASSFPGLEIRQVVLRGDPAGTLCRQAEDKDLLVVGARGRGSFAALRLGSVASKCAHHSRGTVVIVPTPLEEVPEQSPAKDGRIVVGVDMSDGSRHALRWATGQAKSRGWTIQALTVWGRTYSYGADIYWPVDEKIGRRAKLDLDRLVEEVAGDDPAVKIESLAIEGDPSQRLFERSNRAELLVVGGRGRGPLASLLLGSVANKCARHSPRPVAIVHQARPQPDS